MYSNPRRKIDARGRLCIPKNIREVYQLEHSKVEVFTEGDLIIIRKAEENPQSRPSPRGVFRRRGTSHCNFCICSSCIAFRCPWAGCFKRLDVSGLYKARCEQCTRLALEKIHDCDFYEPRKRKTFYRLKIAKKETRHGIVMRELREIKSLLIKE